MATIVSNLCKVAIRNACAASILGHAATLEPRLVTTDAFRPGWIPGERVFMTAEMAFPGGWGKAADQLELLAVSL